MDKEGDALGSEDLDGFEDKLGAELGSCDLVGSALGVADLDGLELKDGARLGI